MRVKNNIPKKVRSQKAGLIWLGIIALIFAELLTYTWIRTEYTQTLLEISALQTTLSEKQSYTKSLKAERDRLKSDNQIIQIARTRYNLVSDTQVETVYMDGE